MTSLPELLTIAQAAERCHCSERTVRRAINEGALRASQLARRGTWIIRAEDVTAWLDIRANRPREIDPLPVSPPAPRNPDARPVRMPSQAKIVISKDMGRAA